MSLLVLTLEGSEHVQAVRLDDPSPGYAEHFAGVVRGYLPAGTVLHWCEVNVSTVADYGPDEIASMLSSEEEELTDLPQRWDTLPPAGLGK